MTHLWCIGCMFAFAIEYYYLFPQLTMWLAPLIGFFKTISPWRGEDLYNRTAFFHGKITVAVT